MSADPAARALIPRSRRAMLAGALGGLAGLVAGRLGRPTEVSAAPGSPLIIGSEANNAGTKDTQLLANSNVVTFKLYQQGPGTALMGYTTPTTGNGRGVYGRADSPNGDGVQARNGGPEGSGVALRAIGGHNTGIDATTVSPNRYAIRAENSSYGLGVLASTVQGTAVLATAEVGDALHATTGSGGYAIRARNNGEGIAISGQSAQGWAGDFIGPVRVSRQVDIAEIATPPAPGAGTGRLFVRSNGSGKSQLCVLFDSGAVQILATEP